MANDGILATIINVDTNKSVILRNVSVVSRGFILINENEELIKEIEQLTKKTVELEMKKKNTTYSDIRNSVSNALTPFLKEKTGRKPIILPIIIDIKKRVY